MSNNNLDRQGFGKSKKEPEYGVVTPYPRVVFKNNRTFVIVQNKAEEDALYAQNKEGSKPIWGETPGVFGVETCPAAPPVQDRPGSW